MKQPTVYIMTNKKDGTLYTGVTSNPAKRFFEHRNGLIKGFSQKYRCKKLVYFEQYAAMFLAINREKQIKGYLRKKKIDLIEKINPDWNDLYEAMYGI